jgi:hypothetical protein
VSKLLVESASVLLMLSETTSNARHYCSWCSEVVRFSLLHYIEGQDATLRGAKDDLNLKENKTNTSRKKLKTLTEDSSQQPVKRKKKRRRNNKNNNSKTQRNPTGMLAPNINS